MPPPNPPRFPTRHPCSNGANGESGVETRTARVAARLLADTDEQQGTGSTDDDQHRIIPGPNPTSFFESSRLRAKPRGSEGTGLFTTTRATAATFRLPCASAPLREPAPPQDGPGLVGTHGRHRRPSTKPSPNRTHSGIVTNPMTEVDTTTRTAVSVSPP